MIHNAVENLTKGSKINHLFTSTEEGNDKQLEYDLNSNYLKTGLIPEKGEVQLAPSKLKKRFTKETIDKFKSSTFDIEKKELNAKNSARKFIK